MRRVREDLSLFQSHTQKNMQTLGPLPCPSDAVQLFELLAFLFQINMTHYIKHLSFGRDYPGIVNPLDGTDVTAQQGKSQLREISF